MIILLLRWHIFCSYGLINLLSGVVVHFANDPLLTIQVEWKYCFAFIQSLVLSYTIVSCASAVTTILLELGRKQTEIFIEF